MVASLVLAACSSGGATKPDGGGGAGGATPAGGSSGTGGQAGAGAGGKGGQAGAGVAGAGGHAGAAGGQAGAGGQGGGASGQGGAGAVCGTPPPAIVLPPENWPWGCTGGWNLDLSFDALGFASADAIWGAASDDLYVVGAASGRGAVAHFDGTSWSGLGSLPSGATPARYDAIWGTSANDVWIAGSATITRRVNQGAWTDASNGIPTGTNTRVVSLWGSGSAMFAAVDTRSGGTYTAGVYQWSGTTWQRMSTPVVTGNVELGGVWGWSPGLFYAVGGKLDTSGQRSGGIIWVYDGCAWSDQSSVLPPDTLELVTISGADGLTIVGGYFTGSPDPSIAALTFNLLGGFVRYNDTSPVGKLMNRVTSVWVDSAGALVGGAADTPAGSVANGDARIGYAASGLTNAPLDSIAAVVTGFWNLPGTNLVWTTTYSTAAPARVYAGHCQQNDPNGGF
jgi:hypothetical protein